MTRPLVTFRCDGSLQVGGGHVMRCLTLADAFSEHGFDCKFITNSDAIEVIPTLSRYNVINDPDIAPSRTDVFIIDHYGLSADYESLWRSHSQVIGVIDDLADRPHCCDVLIDQTYGRLSDDYQLLITNNHSDFLCGSQYALLRKQFSDHRDASLDQRQRCERAERIIVSFGSTNPDSLTQRTLKDLLQFQEWPLTIDVIMGAQAQGQDEVRAIIRETDMHKAELHINVSDMAVFMARADLAVGAGGTTSWERCCLGLPTLLIELADNQTVISQNLHNAGAVHYLGRHTDMQQGDICAVFCDIHQGSETLKIMSQAAAKICDGDGANRIVRHIQGLL